MKASDFNKTPGQQPMPRERRPASFTGDHLVKIVKSVVGLIIIYFFINFAKWGIEFSVKNNVFPIIIQADSTKTVQSDSIKINQ